MDFLLAPRLPGESPSERQCDGDNGTYPTPLRSLEKTKQHPAVFAGEIAKYADAMNQGLFGGLVSLTALERTHEDSCDDRRSFTYAGGPFHAIFPVM